jgi:hypothetical protein
MRRLAVVALAIAGLLLVATPASAATVTITPGTVWTDTAGNVIQAHGEGITKVGDTYYWLGEDKTNGSPFQNVKCYSSTDLRSWRFVANVLTRQSSGDLGPNRIVERPHVIFNASTSTYVMYMHIDNTNYSERKAGVATSGSVCGSYTYRGSFKPLGHDSLDDNLFLDGGTGYFISEDRTSAKLQIYRLSADFLSVASLVQTLNQYESPAMVNRRHVLPVRLAPDRLVHQRQPVHDGHLDHGHLEFVAELRALGDQHLQLADDLHPAGVRQQHDELCVPRRPLELEQPRRFPVRLATADDLRRCRVDDLPIELDDRHEHRCGG